MKLQTVRVPLAGLLPLVVMTKYRYMGLGIAPIATLRPILRELSIDHLAHGRFDRTACADLSGAFRMAGLWNSKSIRRMLV